MRFLVLLLVLTLLVPKSSAQGPDNPDTLLNQAIHLGDLYNWAAAAPLFSRAEKLYTARGDKRNTLLFAFGSDPLQYGTALPTRDVRRTRAGA